MELWAFYKNIAQKMKTRVKFDLGYNPLIFDGVMGLFLKW